MNLVSERHNRPEFQRSILFRPGTSATEIEGMLWSSFRSGNRKALDYIFDKYIRLLFAYGGKISTSNSLVENCIQDLFVDLWAKHEILSDTDNIKLYLLKSLRRRIIRALMATNHIKINTIDEHGYASDLEFSAEFNLIQELNSIEKRDQIEEALAQLTKRQREAVYLKFYERFSYLEIADMMNLTLKSTYKLIGKAIFSLRKHFN